MNAVTGPRLTGAGQGRRKVVGLLNNMPDGALAATERQFANLLNAASDPWEIELRCYTLPEIARSAETKAALARTYHPLSSMRDDPPHALIISGAEPLAARLCDEPYWQSLAGVLTWASAERIGLLLSCLAAHAAVLHWHGIERQRLSQKCSGVFAVEPGAPHALLRGAALPLCTPQSRWNDVPESMLRDAGYAIVTASPVAGVDIFVHPDLPATVFLNGHPEYESVTLAKEYRRDVTRFLHGTSAIYPELPQGYFDAASERRLRDFRARAEARDPERPGADFPDTPTPGQPKWRGLAMTIMRNWLGQVHAPAA